MRNAILFVLLLFAGLHPVLGDDIHVRISPNPASTQVTVHLDKPLSGEISLEVYTVLGTKVMANSFNHPEGVSNVSMNIASLPEGLYLIRVTHGKETAVKRLKIQHS